MSRSNCFLWWEENGVTQGKILGARKEPTTNSTHIRRVGTGIKLGSQRWEASAYSLCQPCFKLVLLPELPQVQHFKLNVLLGQGCCPNSWIKQFSFVYLYNNISKIFSLSD